MTTPADFRASAPRTRSEKVVIALVSCGLLLIVVAYALSRPPHDFLEYWTAAKLLLADQNPYSLPEVFWAEKSLGWNEPVPLMFACPPWALAYLTPLGLIRSYGVAWLFWVAILTVATAVSSWFLMNLYFYETRIREVSDTWLYRSLFAFTFYPTLLALKFAQTAPLLLLGLTGFLFFHYKQRPFLAGLFLSLTLIKPHLLYLVWIAVLLWSLRRRIWAPVTSAALVTALLTAFALSIDPHAFRQYWEFVTGPYLALNPSAMMAVLRNALKGRATIAWQFAPVSVGLIWFAYYWRKYRRQWSWTERMPALVTACMLTAPYGWLFDQTLLVIAVIALAGRLALKEGKLPRRAVLLYTALNVILILGAMVSSPWTYMPAPILFAIALARARKTSNQAAVLQSVAT